MKLIITALLILCSVNAFAGTMVCQEWGYANSPEEFHNIKLEKLENHFVISPEGTVWSASGRTYTKVDPEQYDLVDPNVTVYKLGLELLYVYKEGKNTNIGISHLVEDSDSLFGDKELFSDCKLTAESSKRVKLPKNAMYVSAE